MSREIKSESQPSPEPEAERSGIVLGTPAEGAEQVRSADTGKIRLDDILKQTAEAFRSSLQRSPDQLIIENYNTLQFFWGLAFNEAYISNDAGAAQKRDRIFSYLSVAREVLEQRGYVTGIGGTVSKRSR